jgi:acyl carrier protein
MSQTEIYASLTEVFSDVFMRDDLILREDMTAKDVEGWDSAKMIEIIMCIEERYDVKFSTKDLDSLEKVGDLVRIIGRNKKG